MILHTLLSGKDKCFPRWWICVCKKQQQRNADCRRVWVVETEWLQRQQQKENYLLCLPVEAFQWWFPLSWAFTSLPSLLQPANQWHPYKLYLAALIACRHVGVFLWILISFNCTDICLSAFLCTTLSLGLFLMLWCHQANILPTKCSSSN